MARFLEFFVASLLVAILGIAVGFSLPAHRSFTHSVETNRPLNVVFDMLNGFQRFNDWNRMQQIDPNVKFTLSGPASGVGAKLEYRSSNPRVGNGSWEIAESLQGEEISYRLENPAMGVNKTMRFRFERTGRSQRNVQIKQRYRVEYGMNLIGRYAGMYVASNVGDGIKASLRSLSNALAGVPRVDYTIYEYPLLVVDLPAQNVLKVDVEAPRKDDGVAISMTNQLEWMNKVLTDSGLEKDGPLRIVSIDFSTESFTFQMLQPVRAAGTEPGSSAAKTVAELAVLNITVNGDGNPVVLAQTPPVRAVNTKWIGPAAALQRVRDTLRAWAIVRGYPLEGNGFDDYGVGIPEMLNPDAEFQAFVPLKAAEAP